MSSANATVALAMPVEVSVNDSSGVVVVATTTTASEVDGEQVKQAVYDFAVPLLVLACVISTVFNLLVLVSLRWLRRSINPTLSLSLSLTFADAYASFMLGLGFVVNSYLPLKNLGIGQCFNLVLEALRLSGLVAAALNLLALSFNHYLGILRPLHYASTVTRRSAYIGIVLLWAIPLMLFFTYFSSVPGQGFRSTDCKVIAFLRQSRFSVLLGMLFTVPLIVMMFIYMHIFFIIRQHKIGLFGQGAATTTAQGRHVICKKTSSNSSVTTSLTSSTCTQASRRLQNVKAVYTTLLIIGTYLAGWMPAVFFYVFTCTDSCPFPITQISYRTRISVGIIVNALIVLKSLVDPFIYAARMPEVSEALCRMFRCRPRTNFRHVRGPSYNRHGNNHHNYNFNHSAPCFPRSPGGTPLRGESQRTDCTLAGSRAVYVGRPKGLLPGSQSALSLASLSPSPKLLPSTCTAINNSLNHNGSISRHHMQHIAAATTATNQPTAAATNNTTLTTATAIASSNCKSSCSNNIVVIVANDSDDKNNGLLLNQNNKMTNNNSNSSSSSSSICSGRVNDDTIDNHKVLRLSSCRQFNSSSCLQLASPHRYGSDDDDDDDSSHCRHVHYALRDLLPEQRQHGHLQQQQTSTSAAISAVASVAASVALSTSQYPQQLQSSPITGRNKQKQINSSNSNAFATAASATTTTTLPPPSSSSLHSLAGRCSHRLLASGSHYPYCDQQQELSNGVVTTHMPVLVVKTNL